MATALEITTTYYQSPLGLLRIGGTDTYSSEILCIDRRDDSEYRGSQLSGPVTPVMIQCIADLIPSFQGQRKAFEFPICQEGTDFQQRVWNELMAIPFGKTISYLELSRRLGDTKNIRAAAAANGRNNLVIVVPCHRVIGSKRDLVGYGGGLWRKKWLLEHETKVQWGVQTLF